MVGIKKTLQIAELKRAAKADRKAGIEPLQEHPERPRLRRDCVNGPRPCRFLSCTHHLMLEVSAWGGLLTNHPGLELEELEESCALDVAERGEHTLECVGKYLGITRERARQIEVLALSKLRDALGVSEPISDGDLVTLTRTKSTYVASLLTGVSASELSRHMHASGTPPAPRAVPARQRPELKTILQYGRTHPDFTVREVSTYMHREGRGVTDHVIRSLLKVLVEDGSLARTLVPKGTRGQGSSSRYNLQLGTSLEEETHGDAEEHDAD